MVWPLSYNWLLGWRLITYFGMCPSYALTVARVNNTFRRPLVVFLCFALFRVLTSFDNSSARHWFLQVTDFSVTFKSHAVKSWKKSPKSHQELMVYRSCKGHYVVTSSPHLIGFLHYFGTTSVFTGKSREGTDDESKNTPYTPNIRGDSLTA